MAFHKMVVIGKVAGEIRTRDLPNGGKVASFGLPINFTRPKKNATTGEWEGDSFFINVDVFNRDRIQMADLVVQYLRKGSQVYIEGRLKNNEYTDKNNVKVSRPVLVADVVEFLDGRQDGAMGGESEGGSYSRPAPSRQPAKPANNGGRSFGGGGGGGGEYDDYGEGSPPVSNNRGGKPSHNDDEIPF